MTALVEIEETGAKRKFKVFVARGMTKQKLFDIVAAMKGQWFSSGQIYLEEEGYTEFHVNIGSLLFLGKTGNLKTPSAVKAQKDNEIKSWFTQTARKQIGAHLLINSFGRLQYCFTNFDLKANEYQCSGVSSVNAVYPILRNETEVRVQTLVLGLFYDLEVFGEDIESGSRLHHRFGYRWLKNGNVWEINELVFGNSFLKKYQDFQSRPHFALYVCASAKLVVIDEYSDQKKGHTRCLIQQGGLVIVDGKIGFRVNKVNSYYEFDGMVDTKILELPKGKTVNYKSGIILFLGANESQHNSISWELQILKLQSKTRLNLLMVPEGGHIVAIEDWDIGMQEIWSRHKYERMFDSNIIYSDLNTKVGTKEFEIPDKPMLEKILQIGVDRTLKCDIRKKLSSNALRPEPPLPIEFNFQKFLKVYPKSAEISPQSRGLTIPPVCPPMEYKVGNTVHYMYLPNNKEPGFLDNIEEHYVWIKFDGKQEECCLQYNKRIFKLQNKNLREINEFETIRDNTDISKCDGIDMRMGTDGWIYKSTGKIISTFLSPYYYRYK